MQISDIHFRDDRQNQIAGHLSAIERVLAAVRSRLALHRVDACFLAVTGDIAYHGRETEYALATPFLKKLLDGLRAELAHATCQIVLVPGNHDCDFETQYPEIALRSRILKTDGLEDVTGLEATIVTCIQKPYRDFESRLAPISDKDHLVSEPGPCVQIHEFKVSGNVIRFYALNTAWMSERDETPGKLVFPPAGLSEPLSAPLPSLSIVLQHHPARGWFRPSNARDLTRRLEGLADIILTGHEHESDDASVSRTTGAQVNYIEGYAFQCDGAKGQPTSAFKVIVVDTAMQSQVTYNLILDSDGIYLPETENPPARPLISNPKRLESSFIWSEKGNAFATDLGLPVTHVKRGRVTLDDLFVYPFVRQVPRQPPSTTSNERLSADRIPWLHERTIIVGGELCGKSTLAKKFFADASQSQDLVPVFVRGIDIKSTSPRDCSALIDDAFTKHYSSAKERYRQLPKERKVLIIDDIHRSSKRGEAIDKVLRWCADQFGTILCFADNMLMLDEVGDGPEERILPLFARYEILPFGHSKRNELIYQWCTLGESQENIPEVKRRTARVVQQVNAVLGKRFVPYVPLFVLGILQQIETSGGPDNYTASQGAVFEALATLKLQMNFKEDLLTAKNYLAHFAFALYERRQRFMTISEFDKWHDGYCKEFKLRLDAGDYRRRLVDSQIFQVLDDEVGFLHRFGYYLYVADYFARHIEEPETQARVREMFRSLFHEETSNILVFLCFKASGHTEFIVQMMLESARSVFPQHLPATLEDDARLIGDQIASASPPELDSLCPDTRRARMLEASDGHEPNPYGNLREDDLRLEDEAESNYPPELRECYAAVRSIQLLGQILRNFYGTLGGNQKVEISRAAYELAMRVVSWYFCFITENQRAVAEGLARVIVRDHLREYSDSERLGLEVQRTLHALTELVSTGMIKRAADATGMRALEPVYSEVINGDDGKPLSAAYGLIGLEIALNVSPTTPLEKIRAASKDLRGNLYALRILQHLVLAHLSASFVEEKVTQQVCAALGIKEPPKVVSDGALKQLPRPK